MSECFISQSAGIGGSEVLQGGNCAQSRHPGPSEEDVGQVSKFV